MDTYLYMTDASEPSSGENAERGALTTRSFNARVGKLASAEGQGNNARPSLFVLTCEARRNNVINDDPDVAETLFTRYSQAVANARGIGWTPQESAKQQISKLRVAIKLGALIHVNGLSVCNDIAKAQRMQREAQEGKNDYSPFDGLVKVARFQIANPDKPLAFEVIQGLLIKPVKAELAEADKLEKQMKALDKLTEDDDMSPESRECLQEASSSLMTRIKELGGSTSMRKKAEKLEQATAQASALVELTRERLAKATAALQPDPKLTAYLAARRAELPVDAE